MTTATQTRMEDRAAAEARALTELALGVVLDRIGRLSEADRADLYDLLRELDRAETEEDAASLRATMVELLDARPVRTRPMLPPSTRPPSAEAKRHAGRIGEAVRKAREAADLSRAELAEKSGLPASCVVDVESGSYAANRIIREKLAAALGVDPRAIDPQPE